MPSSAQDSVCLAQLRIPCEADVASQLYQREGVALEDRAAARTGNSAQRMNELDVYETMSNATGFQVGRLLFGPISNVDGRAPTSMNCLLGCMF